MSTPNNKPPPRDPQETGGQDQLKRFKVLSYMINDANFAEAGFKTSMERLAIMRFDAVKMLSANLEQMRLTFRAMARPIFRTEKAAHNLKIPDVSDLVERIRTLATILSVPHISTPNPDPFLKDLSEAIKGDRGAAQRIAERITWNPPRWKKQAIWLRSRDEGKPIESFAKEALTEGVVKAIAAIDYSLPILVMGEKARPQRGQDETAKIRPSELDVQKFWVWLKQEAVRAAETYLLDLPYVPAMFLQEPPDDHGNFLFVQFSGVEVEEGEQGLFTLSEEPIFLDPALVPVTENFLKFYGSARAESASINMTFTTSKSYAINDKADRAKQGSSSYLFKRSGDYWNVAFKNKTISIRDSKGLGYIAFLLQRAAEPIHVMELVSIGAGGKTMSLEESQSHGLSVSELGDAGEILDPQAKDEYRQRIIDLDEEIREAEEINDIDKVLGLKEERSVLTEYLAKALGLGGRDRRASAPLERARSNVRNNINNALKRIERLDPNLARFLRNSIKTGIICCYQPETIVPWVF